MPPGEDEGDGEGEAAAAAAGSACLASWSGRAEELGGLASAAAGEDAGAGARE